MLIIFVSLLYAWYNALHSDTPPVDSCGAMSDPAWDFAVDNPTSGWACPVLCLLYTYCNSAAGIYWNKPCMQVIAASPAAAP